MKVGWIRAGTMCTNYDIDHRRIRHIRVRNTTLGHYQNVPVLILCFFLPAEICRREGNKK
jgi:hypothetical protein